MAKHGRKPSVNEVRLAIRLLLSDGQPQIDAVASELDVSVRSLQRRLAATGTSHSEMVRQVRQAKAIELLTSSSLSISQIAIATGFANPSGFSRAFQSWTGMSPSEYRYWSEFGAK